MSSCRGEAENKQLIIRLNRIEGQIRGIKNMIETDRDCLEVMNQILSASSALRGIWEVVAATHIEECLRSCNDDTKRKETIDLIIKKMKELR